MKKLVLPFIAAIALLASSCSEKFKVDAPYKDITVVYGFLDMNDTAHYIRIQKGFLDENKSALSMAKTADSNFYSNISVRMERYAVSNGTYVDSFHLGRVDLTAEGYPKQPGTFFDAPNYAYKFTDLLSPLHFYRLKITNLVTGKVDSADAPVINETNGPGGLIVSAIDDISTNLEGMSFFSIIPHRFYTIDGVYAVPSPYMFNAQSGPVGVLQAIITFNWDDVDVNTNVHTHRSYDYNVGYTYPKGNGFAFTIENSSLYNALSLGMGDAPANVKRLIDRCDITVYASTPDYLTYQLATEAQGTGLTGGDVSPVYSNVKGDNSIGLFTSRAVHTGKITITDRTVDSLFASPVLAHTRLSGTVY